MNVGELFVSLGFDVDDASLKDFNAKIVEGRNEILQMSAAATGAVYALNALFDSSGHNALDLKNFTDQTGYASEALQKWQAVIHETNPSIGLEEAAQGYKKLAQTLIDIRQGKGNSGALAMLGVTYDPNMTPEMALEQIRAHLQQTIAQNGVGFTTDKLNSIGIGAGAINALRLSRDQFERMGAGGLVNQSTIDANIKYADTIAQIDVEWRKFKMEFTAEWAQPVINKIEEVDKWLQEFYKNVHAVYDYIRQHQDFFKPIEIGVAALAGFWTVTTFPVTAAFVALAAAINDVGKALRGLPSVSGDLYAADKKGLSLLFHNPGKFFDNFADAGGPFGVLGNLMGYKFAPRSSSPQSPAQVNQTNHFHLSQTMSKAEIDSFIQDRVDDAHTQLNLGPAF